MSQITKRALEASLKNLLLQKPLNKITINDITEDCGINRMTFYYHFKDIYDLVEWACLEDLELLLFLRVVDFFDVCFAAMIKHSYCSPGAVRRTLITPNQGNVSIISFFSRLVTMYTIFCLFAFAIFSASGIRICPCVPLPLFVYRK